MNIFLLLFVHSIFIASEATANTCDDALTVGLPKEVAAILGCSFAENIATPKQYPYYVLVQVVNNSVTQAGSIISSKFILTTAQVLFRVTEVRIKIGFVKENNQNRKSLTSSVLTPHQRYNPETKLYNIGLVRCSEISFTDEVKPINLPVLGSSPSLLSGQNVFVVGWGLNSTEGSERYAKHITVSVKDTACDTIRNYPGFICAEYSGISVFSSDFSTLTGYPMIGHSSSGEHTLIAINSGLEHPLIFTSISYFREWIDTHTKVQTD